MNHGTIEMSLQHHIMAVELMKIAIFTVSLQTREETGTCRPHYIVRDSIASCIGDGGILDEDTRNWCLGWNPTTDPNCTKV